jgi:glycosyltransferase involved in cell wall biosynthesis
MQLSMDAITQRGEYFKEKFKQYKCCVLIPTYNNCQTLQHVIDSVSEYTDDIIIVNDGSTDETADILSRNDHYQVLHHSVNQGKGIALRTGFEYAVRHGYDYTITIDSDGQHSASDLPKFIDKLETEPQAIIIGARNMEGTENVPKKSTMGNKISTFWFTFETGIKLSDTQSGFRLYPLYLLKNIRFFTWKYEFEIEVMVRAAWKGINVISVPITVYYAPGEKRITHFRPFKDFTRVFILNVILVFIAVLYVKPLQLINKLKKKGAKQFFKEAFLNAKESNFTKAASVAFGVFMGIVPAWGFQMVIAVFLSVILKLNKVIVLVAAQISIPPMIPLIIYLSFLTGGFVLNQPTAIDFSRELSVETVWKDIYQYVVGSFCLAALMAVATGLITFVLLAMFRKKPSAVSITNYQ